MKPLLVILLLAITVQAQSLADAARKERERRSHVKAAIVITGNGTGTSPGTAENNPTPGNGAPAPAQELPPPQVPPPPDPARIHADELNLLRSKVAGLQDQETALLLKQNDLTNQVYATVIDQTTKDQAQAQLGDVQKQLAAVRLDLEESKKMLDALELQSPPASSRK
jgi:hypothetical protein